MVPFSYARVATGALGVPLPMKHFTFTALDSRVPFFTVTLIV